MSGLYTDDDVAALKRPILDNFHPPTRRSPTWHIRPDEMARAILDAVAPAIAARALREAADEFWIDSLGTKAPLKEVARAHDWLRDRADEIEKVSA